MTMNSTILNNSGKKFLTQTSVSEYISRVNQQLSASRHLLQYASEVCKFSQLQQIPSEVTLLSLFHKTEISSILY